jgi:hypothetical protein
VATGFDSCSNRSVDNDDRVTGFSHHFLGQGCQCSVIQGVRPYLHHVHSTSNGIPNDTKHVRFATGAIKIGDKAQYPPW